MRVTFELHCEGDSIIQISYPTFQSLKEVVFQHLDVMKLVKTQYDT